MYLKILFILVNLIFFHSKLFPQQEGNYNFDGKQTYVFDNKIIRVSLSSNSLIDEYDSLVIDVELTNISSTDIYFFEDPEIKFKSRNFETDRILINLGSDFSTDIEYRVSMKLLSPDSTFKINLKYSMEELRVQNVSNLLQIVFELGFLSNVNEIKKYVSENMKDSDDFEIKYNYLSLNSILVEIFLKRFDLASLFVNIQKNNH